MYLLLFPAQVHGFMHETSDFFLFYDNLFICQVLCTLIYRRRSLYSFLQEKGRSKNDTLLEGDDILCRRISSKAVEDGGMWIMYRVSMSSFLVGFPFMAVQVPSEREMMLHDYFMSDNVCGLISITHFS